MKFEYEKELLQGFVSKSVTESEIAAFIQRNQTRRQRCLKQRGLLGGLFYLRRRDRLQVDEFIGIMGAADMDDNDFFSVLVSDYLYGSGTRSCFRGADVVHEWKPLVPQVYINTSNFLKNSNNCLK